MKKSRLVLGALLVCGVLPSALQAQSSIPKFPPGGAHDGVMPSIERIAYEGDVQYHPDRVLVRFREDAAQGAIQSARDMVATQDVRSYHLVPGLERLEIGVELDVALRLLSSLPFVEYVEPDYIVHAIATPNDTYFNLQWGIHNTGQSIRGTLGTPDADIDGTEAWDSYTGDPNFVVAVIDTGTQWNHEDLDANIWTNSGEIAGNGIDDDGNGFVDDVRGWDFFSNDNNPDDGDGHGTHTAGTVGAEGNNGIGVAGVNWQCKIMVLRFLGPSGGSTSDAISCVEYAADNGALVSNNSWGGGGFSQGLYDAIANAGAQGHLFVAAAGNNGSNNDSSAFYPATYNLDNIVSVAATNNNDGLAGFSNYGATTVDLGAPGVDIASTWSGSSYVWSSGTSMAAPHVAGVAAMVYALNPGWGYQQVKDRLLDTVRPVASLSGNTLSGGVVNAEAAIGGGGGNTTPVVSITSPSDGTTVLEGDTVTFSGTATDSEDGDLSASLAWTSNLQGSLGSGASFSRNDLAVGTHTITAEVTDSGGASASDSVTLTVEEPSSNTAPSVTISSPSDGTTVTEGDSVSFVGSASDAEDGDITASLAWSSNLQGALGNGGSFSRSDLVPGNHTITASVSDSGGLTGSDSVTLIVEELPPDTPPNAPGPPNLTNLGGGSVRIDWSDNSNNENGFQIERQFRWWWWWFSSGIIADLPADTTTHTDSPGPGRYRYRVRAYNDVGTSSWSSWSSIRL